MQKCANLVDLEKCCKTAPGRDAGSGPLPEVVQLARAAHHEEEKPAAPEKAPKKKGKKGAKEKHPEAPPSDAESTSRFRSRIKILR